MSLPTNNAGLSRLAALVDRLTAADMKGICPAFDLWHDRRWKTIEESLCLWCSDPTTNRFIDKYADSLAYDLLGLLNAGRVSVAADDAMDIMEELFAQGENFYAMMKPATNPETSASSLARVRLVPWPAASSALNQVKP